MNAYIARWPFCHHHCHLVNVIQMCYGVRAEDFNSLLCTVITAK